MKRIKGYKTVLCLGLAAVLSAGTAITALADATPEEMARLDDNQMEYDEVFNLIKYKYGPIKSAYAQVESSISGSEDILLETSLVADDLMRTAQDLEDSMEGMSPEAKASVRAQISALKSQASATRNTLFFSNQQINSSRDYASRTLDRTTNGLTWQVESLMNQYQQLLSQRQIAAKAVELSQRARDLQVQMESQGMAVSADVLSASAQLSSAQDQLKSLDDGIETLRETLCSFAGVSPGGDMQIGAVPAADAAAVSSIDITGDLEKAVNNNYNVIAMRSGGSSQSLVEQQLVKSTTAKKNKMRDTEYTENQVRSNVQTLYDDILEKKALYDSASTAWQSAQNTWNAVQVQRQTGMLSDVQYLQQELAYLQAKSQMECADLNLQQSMRSYGWAVKGVEVTAE
ncbi:MAG TPA: TolC family protein [Candidatus Enterocloster faecavium]|uniref:TolC family protein n=1 Tax=Candidatus Enterocloster faecavium TaxID=2838560 RepID=A0A9D2L5R9_9FIRM|nr:TolC family protein [Candidatus Enterocloster faecavium]